MGSMTANLTDKDKKLLIFLAFFAVIAIFGFLIIKPLVTKNAELVVQIEDLQNQKTAFEQKKAELPMLRVQNTENQQKIAELKSGFEDTMESQQIDNLLTEKALSAGVLASSLSITMPTSPLSLTVYPYSNIALSAEPVEEETTYVRKAEADADAIEAAAGTSDDSSSSSSSSAVIGSQSLVSAAEARFELKGNMETLKNIVDDYSINTPAIRLKSVSWSGTSDDKTTGTVNLTLEIDMCDKDDATEAATEAATDEQ
jgi:cell division protein FtsB